MDKAIILFVWILNINSLFATGRIPDYLILEKDTIAIFSNPLEQYFKKVGKRELIDFHTDCFSTDCWRGYKALWELRNDSLFLKRISACNENCGTPQDANLQAMFGEAFPFANWVNGKLIAPQGEMLKYIHLGYASIYEKEQIFKIKNGLLKRVKLKTNKKEALQVYKEKQRIKFIKLSTDTIFQTIKSKLDWKVLNRSGYLCDDEYILTFNKNGKIKSVKFAPWSGSKFLDWWYSLLDLPCKRKIKRALRTLDMKYLNLPVKVKMNFEVFYDEEKEELELWSPFFGKGGMGKR